MVILALIDEKKVVVLEVKCRRKGSISLDELVDEAKNEPWYIKLKEGWKGSITLKEYGETHVKVRDGRDIGEMYVYKITDGPEGLKDKYVLSEIELPTDEKGRIKLSIEGIKLLALFYEADGIESELKDL